MPFSSQNIDVPKALWMAIEDDLKSLELSEETLTNYTIHPTNMAVELVGKDPDVLKDNKAFRVLMPEGGGVLDLFDYVAGRGDFYLQISPTLVNDQPYFLRYISESPGQMVGKNQWGNGCGKIYDLKEASHEIFADGGLLVSTGKRHYLHLMAGLYIVYQMVDDRLLMGYVRITDSRYPQFHCDS